MEKKEEKQNVFWGSDTRKKKTVFGKDIGPTVQTIFGAVIPDYVESDTSHQDHSISK